MLGPSAGGTVAGADSMVAEAVASTAVVAASVAAEGSMEAAAGVTAEAGMEVVGTVAGVTVAVGAGEVAGAGGSEGGPGPIGRPITAITGVGDIHTIGPTLTTLTTHPTRVTPLVLTIAKSRGTALRLMRPVLLLPGPIRHSIPG